MSTDSARNQASGSAGASPSPCGAAGASPSRKPLPQRCHPIHGVLPETSKSTIVFVTVCTKDRKPWLADEAVHQLLLLVWKHSTAWTVGRYVIMPDHIHLFATPGEPELPLENWIRYWKSQFTKRHSVPEHLWQTNHWDRRLRSNESYDEKWNYVRKNPQRHHLVVQVEDWPYQGELNELMW